MLVRIHTPIKNHHRIKPIVVIKETTLHTSKHKPLLVSVSQKYDWYIRTTIYSIRYMTGMDNKKTGISVIQWEADECRRTREKALKMSRNHSLHLSA